MKDIKQIRKNYDLITEKEESETNRLTQLVRAGLFDAKKLSFLKRALSKDITKMTSADKKVLLELLDVLMNEVINNTGVYSKVKHNVLAKEEFLDESAKDYTSKFDPRFTKWPSDSEIPVVLILKRKSIRIFPDMQKVALYYAQAIDKYVTIPFGAGVMNEAKDDDEDKRKKRYAPYERLQAPYRERKRDDELAKINVSRVDPNQGGPATERKNKVLRRAIRGAALQTALKNAGSGDFNAAAGMLGFVAGAAARAATKRVVGALRKNKSTGSSPSPSPTPAPSNSPSPSPAPGPKLRLVSNTPNPVASSAGGAKPQLKVVKESFRSKLNEKRKLQEVAPAVALAVPLITGGARLAAPHLGRLATKYAPTIAKTLGVGVGAKVATDAMKDGAETAARERQGERESGASFIARRSLNKRIRANERDAAEIAKASAISTRTQSTVAPPATAKKDTDSVAIASRIRADERDAAEIAKSSDISKKMIPLPTAQTTRKEITKDADSAATLARIRADERDAAEISKVSSIAKAPTIPTQGRDVELPKIPITGNDITLPEIPKTSADKPADIPAAAAGQPASAAGQKAAAPAIPTVQPADVAGVGAAAAAGAAAQARATSKATPRTDAVAKTTPRKPDGKKPGPRTPRGFGLPDFTPSKDEPIKYSEPGAFSLKANISGPKPDDTTETRKERERQAFFKEQEEVDDETKRRLVQQIMRQQARSRSPFGLKASVSAPKGSSYNPARDEKQRQVVFRQAQIQTNEQTIIDQLQQAKNEGLNEYIININESKVMINSTIANKILNVYESLNQDNKIKFEKLLNESSESFKKAATFSLRQ